MGSLSTSSDAAKPTSEASPYPDWELTPLPTSWADSFDFATFSGFYQFLRHILGARQRVSLPQETPGLHSIIPKYALQEFHNVPNGNYSNKLTPGYIRGFDISMLKTVENARFFLANAVKDKNCVVDIGCAGGKTAAAVKNMDVNEVWGIDPSPYLLNQAIQAFPNIRFRQATAEQTGFNTAAIDGITACFVLHEIPPKYRHLAIVEFHRILKKDGILAIAEPSAIQYQPRFKWQFFKQWGFKGIYFAILAKFVYEPFIASWHQENIPHWLESHGFTVISDIDGCPIRTIIAKKN